MKIAVTRKSNMFFICATILLVFGIRNTIRAEQAPNLKHLDLAEYKMPYIDVGSGEPVLFVHGAIGDLRTWAGYQQPISQTHRFISYTRRHYGEQDWAVSEPRYSHDQHAEDLIALIESINAGPVHLVTWSSGGVTSTIAAANRPDLVKSIVHFEPVLDGVMSSVPGADKLGADWGALWGPVVESAQAGNHEEAAKKMVEVVFELPEGGFAKMPAENQGIVLDNARTIPLLFFANDTKTNPDCAFLGKIEAPTSVVLGGETNDWWSLMSKEISKCMPNAKLSTINGVNHNGPIFAVSEIVEIISNQIAAVK